jgi:hypothetical protein
MLLRENLSHHHLAQRLAQRESPEMAQQRLSSASPVSNADRISLLDPSLTLHDVSDQTVLLQMCFLKDLFEQLFLQLI